MDYDKTEGTPTADDITVTWTFTLDWDWHDDEPTVAEYGVRATDDAAADSGWDLTNIDVDYENDLDLTGTLAVSATDNGAVTCGTTWVHGSETLTWSGLSVVYEGYGTSPADADFDIRDHRRRHGKLDPGHGRRAEPGHDERCRDGRLGHPHRGDDQHSLAGHGRLERDLRDQGRRHAAGDAGGRRGGQPDLVEHHDQLDGLRRRRHGGGG